MYSDQRINYRRTKELGNRMNKAITEIYNKYNEGQTSIKEGLRLEEEIEKATDFNIKLRHEVNILKEKLNLAYNSKQRFVSSDIRDVY